jgi:hypothetical protein
MLPNLHMKAEFKKYDYSTKRVVISINTIYRGNIE